MRLGTAAGSASESRSRLLCNIDESTGKWETGDGSETPIIHVTSFGLEMLRGHHLLVLSYPFVPLLFQRVARLPTA